MMYLISGQPGNGKTLRAMSMALEFYEQNQQQVKDGKAQPRRFFTNIAGATVEEGADAFPWMERLPDHNDWTQLPDGSFVIYDEAHSDGNTQGLERYGKLFPSTGKPGESDDPRIRAMSTHRHRGFDLVFVTQWPNKIHHQVRTLIGSHTHMNRSFGMQRAGVLTWSRVQSDPYDEKVRDKAEEEIWAYPKTLYSRYRSATLHTASHKFKVPKKVWQALSVTIALVLGVWMIYAFIIKPPPVPKKVDQGAGALPAAGALAPLGAGVPAARPLTREEYIERHKPRIEYQPWSAPAFDDRSVQSQPELYCMASGTTEQDTTCTCVTEQGTKAKISIPVCIAIARDGPAYNPYRAPRQEAESHRDDSARSAARSEPSGSPEPSPHALVEVGKRPMGTFPESPPYPASF
ncbi:zonular occludens toxin domain-containing protein [uncultured Stenotrophomonas sp.]|uniref:zonular occludens toxin domain-containing protein n=1 Tax=uncultured Stenotrophomonas sp. TaxID=165438 RepID=UPI0025CBAD55|nr:zonular occludens toxin domain-containing protein [uncultured Stenotrophomonas sp.]